MSSEMYDVKYKNNLGGFNVLITKSSKDGKIIIRDLYNAHLWINDNTIKKNHTDDQTIRVNDFVSNEKIDLIIKALSMKNTTTEQGMSQEASPIKNTITKDDITPLLEEILGYEIQNSNIETLREDGRPIGLSISVVPKRKVEFIDLMFKIVKSGDL